MGRKKRKVATLDAESSDAVDVAPPPPPPPPPRIDPRMNRAVQQPPEAKESDSPKKMSSSYAATSHSAEIIDEDIYVSDGSESDEDLMADRLETMNTEDEGEEEKTSNIAGRSIEMVLSGSKMGLMRRGIHRPQALVQPNRQWARQTPQQDDQTNADNNNDEEEDEEKRKQQQEEELAKLDPAQRAARLLAEKQRKLEEAKILARKLESEENAGRDPCLFSKRTSFDIRFDQIDDKPWMRGAGDITDFFNYGFSEEDWLEYGEQQLLIRQELIDASRQKRAPDPSIVPVIPKKPKKQNPRVAVATEVKEEDGDKSNEDGGAKEEDDDGETSATIGPVLKKPKTEETMSKNDGTANDLPDVQIGAGGAWGMGAAPGSKLAQLIEEQEKQQQQQQQQHNNTHYDAPQDSSSPRKGYHGNRYENNAAPSYYGNSGGNDGDYNDNDSQNDHSYGGYNKQQNEDPRHGGDRNYNRYDNRQGHHDGDWNSRNNDRHQYNDRGGYRGGNRNRRDDYEKGRNRGGNNYGGGGYRRKRGRDDYDDRYSRR